MTDMKKFFTREKASEGIQVDLFEPGAEEPSGQWLRVRGVDSDEFRQAEVETKRRQRESIASGKQPLDTHLEEMRILIASLVAGWSFPEECTQEAVVEFFRQAPQIQEVVNQLAAKRSLFFKNGSDSSVDSQKPNSN
jgi:hypothetical protein